MSVRASTVLIVLAAARLALPVQPAAAADNPHNLGSCSACHPITPRFGVDTRYNVTFTTSADDPGLCAACHPAGKHPHPVLVVAGSGPAGARASGYLPAGTSAAFAGKIVCTSCHFIHAADTRYGLLRGFPGSPDPRYFASVAAFCEECHGGESGVAPAARRRRAAPAPSATPASRAASGRPRCPSGFRERCELCHRGVKDEHFAKITPFGKARECLLCHDRHGVSAASPGLLSAGYRAAAADSVVIRPHFRRSLCFACHANTDDYALRDEDVNALCDRCHASGKILANIHPLRTVPPDDHRAEGVAADRRRADLPDLPRPGPRGPAAAALDAPRRARTPRRARCAATATAGRPRGQQDSPGDQRGQVVRDVPQGAAPARARTRSRR